MKRSALALFAIILVPLALAACGDDDDTATTTPTSGATTTVTTTPSGETPTAEATPTEGASLPDFEDPQTVMSEDHQVEGNAQLVDVRIGRHDEGYDRIVFEFDGGQLPSWEAKYVPQPVACASGKNVVLGGVAALEVVFTSAQAHDEQGELTIPGTDLTPDYPAIVQAVQSCDFEGIVTWDVGTNDDLPFRAFEMTNPTRLVVDIEHP